MKKFVIVSVITLLLLSQAIVSTYGKENEKNENRKNNKPEIKTDVKHDNAKNGLNNSDETENEKNENGKDNDNKNRIKFFEKKNHEFKLWGQIQASSSSSITINNQVITIDSSVTGKIKEVGNPAVGIYAKVEGVIINGIYYAEKIVVDNRDKDEDENETPALTTSPSVTESVTVTPTVTEALSPTLTITPLINVQGNNKFILGQIIEALEKFLNSLKEITHI